MGRTCALPACLCRQAQAGTPGVAGVWRRDKKGLKLELGWGIRKTVLPPGRFFVDSGRTRLRLAVSAFLFLVGSIFITAGLFLFFQEKDATGQQQAEETGIVVDRGKEDGEREQAGVISIDVAGAVNEPGVYTLPAKANITDAIRLAGGFLDEADKHWVARQLNMAEGLVDRQKIYIPFLGEQMISKSDSLFIKRPQPSAKKLIDLNLAGQAELESLPEIGSKRAEAIIKGRPYRQTSDLLEEGILGERAYAAVKDLVSVGGG